MATSPPPIDDPWHATPAADPTGPAADALHPPGWSSPPPADLGRHESAGVWMLIWTIVAVKLITLVATLLAAGSWDAGTFLAITTWPWLLVLALLVAGPVLFRLRLRRVRARRGALLRAEWLLDGE